MTLGFTGTLTGEFAHYAVSMQQGAQLAVSEINASGGIEGQQAKLLPVDDGGEPKNGPVVAQQLCDNSAVAAILGYSFSSVALAAVPIYNQCQVPILASAVTSPQLSGSTPYFHRNVPTDAFQGAQMGTYAVNTLGFKNVATLHQVDDYGNGVTAAFESAVKSAGGQIVSSDGYQLGTKDFLALVTKVGQEKSDALFIGGFYPEASKIAQQARQVGYTGQILGTDGSLSPDLIKLGGSAVDGMIIYGVFDPSVSLPVVQKFVSSFKAMFNTAPDSWAALAYDAVYTIKAAAEAAGGTSRADIQKGLSLVQNLPGVTGTTTFNSQGDRTLKILFLQVQNGAFAPAPKQP